MKFNAFEIDPIIDNYMHKKDDPYRSIEYYS